MDASIQRLLSDKVYEKRKQGALDLEKSLRECVAARDFEKVGKIVYQLCEDYAYAVHHPHARNGGLIGLAAAAIGLGTEHVAPYLEQIVPPVLACFVDPDARVRYYACESMYNISKIAKGEILIFFNPIFDALCKLSADNEPSVKNGSELLDRLIKDIVMECSATYVSILAKPIDLADEKRQEGQPYEEKFIDRAFSLKKFIPLLEERIYVLNPYTRTFLVSWIQILDSIPDLELVSYLPSFLGGLMRFLSDSNREVHVYTKRVLDILLSEIRHIAKVKADIAANEAKSLQIQADEVVESKEPSIRSKHSQKVTLSESYKDDSAIHDTDDEDAESENSGSEDLEGGEWVFGQDTFIDYSKILDILLGYLEPSVEEEIQLVALSWIDALFEICSADVLANVPQLLSQILRAKASNSDPVRSAADKIDSALKAYIESLPDEDLSRAASSVNISGVAGKLKERVRGENDDDAASTDEFESSLALAVPPGETTVDGDSIKSAVKPLDYRDAVKVLTKNFHDEHEATRTGAISWLILLHGKAPSKILNKDDDIFSALLQTLSDPAESVVTRDLQLLAQISQHSDDAYFTSFMANLIKHFASDRSLLESRGNLIIRQLCASLNAEKIYRAMADIIEHEEEIELAATIVELLNDNLLIAKELADLRRKLRTPDSKDQTSLFLTLYKPWCYSAIAAFSLCLLAQAYEQAYSLLQTFGDFEMTVTMLIQIDKLIQLIESPIFTYLRLQLLEPERFPYLYKCMYGMLMLLPQSSAFAALKNRLGSVSAIGFIGFPPRPSATASAAAGFDRPNRLKTREESAVRWPDLLDKFKSAQDKIRRSKQGMPPASPMKKKKDPTTDDGESKPEGGPVKTIGFADPVISTSKPVPLPAHRSKSSLGNLSSKIARGVGVQRSKK